MSEPNGPSPGEWAGIITAAGIAAGATFKGLGAGFRWIAGWRERQARSRDEKLAAWHEELIEERAEIARERAQIYAEMREEMTVLKRQIGAVHLAYQLVAGAMRVVDPHNPSLREADLLMHAAFPLDPALPPDMRSMLASIP